MDEKENKRIISTKLFLKRALIELLKTKSLDNISVTELCDFAHINRGTFYKHYSDVFALLNEVEIESYKRINEFIKEDAAGKTTTEIFAEALNSIKENEDIYSIIFNRKINKNISLEFIDVKNAPFYKKWKDEFPKYTDFQMEEMFVFVSVGVIALIGKWVRGGYKEPVEDIAKLLTTFTSPFHLKFYDK